ncbi:MAG: dimethyl sulfoxide reductase anchor subunit [Melioribacter sp.]|nr:dimethyl sulfoxide reductase anchor subunit [Melioribacter sp.]
MLSSDWPLILFTLFVQMSVGTFLFLGILHDVSFVKLEERIFEMVSNSLLKLISVILMLAVMASLFHLGSPQKAINALNNLESSYLSREILSLIIYILFGGVFLIIYIKYNTKILLIFFLALITILFGFRTIYYMSSIYMLETVPVWNSLFTPLSFYLSVLLLGSSLIFYSLIRIINRNNLLTAPDESTGKKLSFTLHFLLITTNLLVLLNLTLFFIQIVYLSTGDETLRASYDLLVKENLFFVISKIILLVTAIAFSFSLIKKFRIEKVLLSLNRYSTFYFVLIILIELIGRYLFYASYHRIGV